MMARLLRLSIASILMVLMPFQAVTAMYLDVRGPLHFHIETDDADDDHDDHAHARAHVHAHPHTHVHSRAHAHDAQHPQRHYHDRADASVVKIGGGSLDFGALQGETRCGWSSIMLAAIVGDDLALELSELSNVMTALLQPVLQRWFPGRLERPPRIRLA